MTINVNRTAAPQNNVPNAPTSKSGFDGARVAINYDPYAVLRAGLGIGDPKGQRNMGQVSAFELSTGFEAARKYYRGLLEGNSPVGRAIEAFQTQKTPEFTEKSSEIIDKMYDLYCHFEQNEKFEHKYNSTDRWKAWNSMNKLILELQQTLR